MKLLFYCHDWSPSIGGVQTITVILANGIVEWSKVHPEQTISLTLVANTRAGDMDDSSLPFRVVRQPNIWQLLRLIRYSDVIHLAGPSILPLALGWLLRKPTVIEHHGYQSICLNGLLLVEPERSSCPSHFMASHYGKCIRCNSSDLGWAKSFRNLLLTFVRRWLSRRVAANIMISNHLGARLKLPRSTTIYYGIHDPPPVNVEDTPSVSTPFEIAYVGRLVPEKGLPLLLEAAGWLKEQKVAFKLSFIGGGSEQGRLEQMVQQLGLSGFVTFTGDLRGADLRKAVSEIAAVVMPSVCEETAGLSAIEQMMRGRVVIASDIGGLGEVVDDAGLKFPPGDWRGLAACIQKVMGDPSLVASLGSAARARAVQLFNRHSMIEAHISVYREVARH